MTAGIIRDPSVIFYFAPEILLIFFALTAFQAQRNCFFLLCIELFYAEPG